MDPPAPTDLAARLFADHGLAVRRYFHRLTRRAEAADDLSQDVFLKVVRAAGTYQPRERAGVFRIAQNVLLDYYRRAGRTRGGSKHLRDLRSGETVEFPLPGASFPVQQVLEGQQTALRVTVRRVW